MFDLLIKGGMIIDGSGADAFAADIAVKGDRIAAIGCLEEADAYQTVDAMGKYITPGFIDTHSHADCSAFLYPACESYLRQGITTFIGGQCGDSSAPIFNYWMRKYWEYDYWHEMDPFIFSARTVLPVDKVLPVIERHTGYRIDWQSFSEYAAVLKRQGLGCNMISLAGHSQIRADVMGPECDRCPSAEEMSRMKEHIEEAFSAGVWGLSTGRDYPPSAYADLAELRDLLAFTRDLGGYYFTHWRRTGVRSRTPLKANRLDGIREALDLCREIGIKTQISHLTHGFDIYPMLPQMEEAAARCTLDFIDSYIAEGTDVAFDVIPGESGGICINPYLASYFIPWIKMSGSLKQFITNLSVPAYAEDLKATLRGGNWYPLNPKIDPDWDAKTEIIKCTDRHSTGQSIRQLQESRTGDAIDTAIELLLFDPHIMIKRVNKTMAEVKTLIWHERGGVCTDTYAFDLQGTYGQTGEVAELLPHPHTYCAFPKFLTELSCGRIEDDIRKITGWPAQFLDIPKRGLLKEGYYADILILNADNLKTNENYIEPRVNPAGIDLVVVNGSVAVDTQGHKGVLAGRLLTR